MSVENRNAIHALAAVNVAGGAATFAMARGLNTPVNTGAGDYSFHYDQPIDAAESVAFACCRSAVFAAVTLVRTDDDHLRMLTWADGVGALDNIPVSLLVIRI